MTLLRFDQYMDLALYGPDGFYTNEGSAGRRSGDFLTSPEVGPLFGAVLAEAIDQWWSEAGRPDPFTVYDVGCGPGTLLRTIAAARGGTELDRPWRLVGVDVAGSAAELDRLPDDLSGSVVIANELLDNLPFRILERTGAGWSEVGVRLDESSAVEELFATDLAPALDGLDDLAPGVRVPILERAEAWVSSVLDRAPVALCVFDYGLAETASLGRRGGWLRTYRDHRRGQDPLAAPGRTDITTDIGWDQLPTPALLQPQAEFLRTWSIDRLVEEGRTYWKNNAHAPDLTAIRMRSRVSEAEALLDPAGLGRWLTGVWNRDSPRSDKF